jgi:hypothetical protein
VADYPGDTLFESMSIRDASKGSGKSLEMQAKAGAGIQSGGRAAKRVRSVSIA